MEIQVAAGMVVEVAAQRSQLQRRVVQVEPVASVVAAAAVVVSG
jgi:hypothetical protein